jgi:cytosine/adenosine deaminase-related metal-dependent hydrolase
MSHGWLLAILVLLSASACAERGADAAPDSVTYDLVLIGGRVMDPETGRDEIANLGIRDGRIAVITGQPIAGTDAIDARGMVVAPGFIDTHNHWPRPMGYKLMLRDGVTTSMDLEAGVFGPRVGDWYDMHAGRSQVNYGTGSGHEFARNHVLSGTDPSLLLDAPASIMQRGVNDNWALEVPTLEQGSAVLRLVDEGLRQGALAISSTLGYMPGATAREVMELQRVGARYGRPTTFHLRNTPGNATEEINGAQEILANALALNAPVVINHINNPGWRLVQELLVGFRARGVNAWGEIYPYAAGSTTINAVFLKPEVWVEEMGRPYETTMQDPFTGEFYTLETYRKTVAEAPSTVVVLYKMPAENIPHWCALPGIVYAGDGMPAPGGWDAVPWESAYETLPNTHPRLAGTRGRCLRMAREHDIPLMQVIASASYNIASYLSRTGLASMQVRGRLQEGMIADITVFDPDTVTDNATYERGTLPSSGIPFVIVNGRVVVRDSRVLPDVYPGQPIRFPVEDAPRFEPLDTAVWAADVVAPDA